MRTVATLPHVRPPVLMPRGLGVFQGWDAAAGHRSWGVRWVCGRGSGRDRSAASKAVPLIPYCGFCRQASTSQTRLLGKGLLDLMERTVVRCADGHVFTTASFPMQQAERLGPGRAAPVPAVYAAPERRARQLPEAVASGCEQRTVSSSEQRTKT